MGTFRVARITLEPFISKRTHFHAHSGRPQKKLSRVLQKLIILLYVVESTQAANCRNSFNLFLLHSVIFLITLRGNWRVTLCHCGGKAEECRQRKPTLRPAFFNRGTKAEPWSSTVQLLRLFNADMLNVYGNAIRRLDQIDGYFRMSPIQERRKRGEKRARRKGARRKRETSLSLLYTFL